MHVFMPCSTSPLRVCVFLLSLAAGEKVKIKCEEKNRLFMHACVTCVPC